MKYSDIVNAEPLGVKRATAAQMVGGETILTELLEKKLIKPRISRHKLTIFDVQELKQAWETLGQCPDHSEGV